MPKLPPWLVGNDDLSSPVPRNLTANSDNEQAYADLHNIERKRCKRGKHDLLSYSTESRVRIIRAVYWLRQLIYE